MNKREKIESMFDDWLLDDKPMPVSAFIDAILDELMEPGEPAATIMLKEMIRCIHNPQVNSGMRADAPEIVLHAILTHIKDGKP